jgi:hypothetical protein
MTKLVLWKGRFLNPKPFFSQKMTQPTTPKPFLSGMHEMIKGGIFN